MTLEAIEPEHDPSDPENDVIELQPPRAGSSRDAWDEVIADLFGEPPWANIAPDDKELGDVAKKMRASLPDAVKQFQSGAGLFFRQRPVPDRARRAARRRRRDEPALDPDRVVRCQTLHRHVHERALVPVPTSPPGKTASVSRTEALDWMIEQRDGGVMGGESIKLLSARRQEVGSGE